MIRNLLLIVVLAVNTGGKKFLEEIPLYQKESYFKEKVYKEHDSKSFFELKEANAVVNPDAYDLHLLNAAVFFATNKLRTEKKQKQLSFSAPLRDAAVVHSWQMVEKKFLNHFNSRVPKLRSPNDRMKLFGVPDVAQGENVDWNHIDPHNTTYAQVAKLIVDDFFRSAEHRKTMLSKSYTRLGCAAVFEASDKNGVRYFKATQNYSAE